MKYWKNKAFDESSNFGTVASLAFATTQSDVPLESGIWVECAEIEIEESGAVGTWHDETGIYYTHLKK